MTSGLVSPELVGRMAHEWWTASGERSTGRLVELVAHYVETYAAAGIPDFSLRALHEAERIAEQRGQLPHQQHRPVIA